jgi:osomolarity two-component system response regulator SSK1
MAIGDLKQRLRNKFSRRNSTASSSQSNDTDHQQQQQQYRPQSSKPATIRSIRSRASKQPASILERTVDGEKPLDELDAGGVPLGTTLGENHLDSAPKKTIAIPGTEERLSSKHNSTSTDFPTPNTDTPFLPEEQDAAEDTFGDVTYLPTSPTTEERLQKTPGELHRRQSLLASGQTRLIKTLLETELRPQTGTASIDYFTANGPSTISGNMVSRKLWVKRPGASATLVTIHEDDLVDDVRDMILKKYANSLGRNFDAPDVTLRIIPREQRQERTLGPEEPMGRTLDAYFPGGQTVDEALVIDVPLRRTPKPSPHTSRHHYEDSLRPHEGGSDYFPPMPATAPAAPPSPRIQNTLPVNLPNHSHASLQHSMSVLATGHVPALPSPGAGTRRPHHNHQNRPRIGRQHTSSPTIINGHPSQQVTNMANNGMPTFTRTSHPRTHSNASEKSNAPPVAPPLPSPPAPSSLNADVSQIVRAATPPPRVSSPRATNRPRRKKANGDHPSLPAGMLNGAVPPIKVLIVEDNSINLKLLEAFMKRLKVRWQTAINGKEAVTKWRAGGFHLVLMDIQLPIMSGLEATKEIRRLERLNNIGVFSSSASSSAPSMAEGREEVDGDDRLPTNIHFKSPVIIVALTASSLQSDRHEALAAGCNDFLTKVCFHSLFTFPLHSFLLNILTLCFLARQLRLARTQSHGMGLHASSHRFRRLAQVEGFQSGEPA